MKLFSIVMLFAACGSIGPVQAGSAFSSFIRQVQVPSGVQWDLPVSASGEQVSPLAVDEGGARFELWTVETAATGSRLDAWSGESFAPVSHLLDTRFVGAYVPVAAVSIRSEDSYSVIPRTRADRPFFVDVSVDGLLGGVADPEAAKAVKLLRHVQSYGTGGTGEEIDRAQATLQFQTLISQNGSQTLSYSLTSIPAEDLAKVRGEERFSIYSLEDALAPESQIASKFIQIWPVADGSISGISNGQRIRFAMPQLTLTLNDLYPDSRTYAQVYPGSPQLGVEGRTVPGSSLIVNDTVPNNRVLVLEDYDSVFDAEGLWTMELLTITPFGIDRLAYVSFEIDRVIELNGTFTTIE